MPGEMKLSEFLNKAAGLGWALVRISGSHHILKNPRLSRTLAIPVHGGKVKPFYVKALEKASAD
jgi:predicted RNA binding protein YcfA (HicA-like mRNA interferase family)